MRAIGLLRVLTSLSLPFLRGGRHILSYSVSFNDGDVCWVKLFGLASRLVAT
jgi:hypothetical protein